MVSKCARLLAVAVLFAVVLPVITASVSAWPWSSVARIRVVVYGNKYSPQGFYPALVQNERFTIKILDANGNTETFTHVVSSGEMLANSFKHYSTKYFYIDDPVDVWITRYPTGSKPFTRHGTVPEGRPPLHYKSIVFQY